MNFLYFFVSKNIYYNHEETLHFRSSIGFLSHISSSPWNKLPTDPHLPPTLDTFFAFSGGGPEKTSVDLHLNHNINQLFYSKYEKNNKIHVIKNRFIYITKLMKDVT